jgi:hypothetical protein
VFVIEIVVKITAYSKNYFKYGWNIFDLIIVLLSCSSIFISKNSRFNFKGATSIVRTFRVGRMMRLLHKAKSLKIIFNAIIISLPALANVGCLLFLLLYLYSIIGMELFGNVLNVNTSTDRLNFENFGNAFLTLFVITTGDGWTDIMNSYLKERSIDY